MVTKDSILFSLWVLLWIGCETSPSANQSAASDLTCHLLFFKKEQKIEVWKAGNKNNLLDSFQLKVPLQLPLGPFSLQFDEKANNLQIEYPNEFYRSKGIQFDERLIPILEKNNMPKQFFEQFENVRFTKIIIFPNDKRIDGDFSPCFACPHWMAEIYAFLNLKIKEYN